MMERKLESFQDYIRPICLANKDTKEKPTCPDNSKDTIVWKKSGKTALKESEFKMPGGCATVAGWGHRYDKENSGGRCTTDTSPLAPSKAE